MVYNASWNQGFLVPCSIPPPDFGKVFPFLLLRVGAPEAGVGIDGESFFFVFLPTGEARFLESVDPEELSNLLDALIKPELLAQLGEAVTSAFAFLVDLRNPEARAQLGEVDPFLPLVRRLNGQI